MPTDPELLRLFDRSPIGMYRADANGRVLTANPALVAMLGYDTVAEVLALDLQRDVYVGDRAPVLEEYKHSGFVEGRRVQWKTRSGRVLTVHLSGHVVETSGGLVLDATVIGLTDVDAIDSELRRERDAHETTSRILELVLGNMPAIYWLMDRDLRLLRTGGAVEQILGISRDRFLGRTLEEALAEDPSAGSLEAHRAALAGETVFGEGEYRGKLLASVHRPYRAANGEVIGVVGSCIDVTSWRALERRMVDAQRAESLGVLAGGLAHDFNNLLVAVLGNADLALREISGNAPVRAAIENIRIAGLRAAELTDQLLAYAGRGGAGKTRIEPAGVVDELVRILAPSIPDGVKVNVEVPDKLALRGDPAQLRQVLLNLINNARDALTPRGGSITVRATPLQADGQADPDDVLTAPAGAYIAIDVTDNGPGMDSETRRHVFEPFFTTKQTGHGLGLAAVLGIVRAHGGGIRVQSAPDRGARFLILWPAAVTLTPPLGTAIRANLPCVLVIDDEDLVRDVVARMVEDLGYAALTAADGKTGLALVEQRTVDAVLVDMSMPTMSGADVVAALREKRPNLPIVVCSGYDRDGRGPVQADAYLPKPFRLDALERTLAKLLPLRSV